MSRPTLEGTAPAQAARARAASNGALKLTQVVGKIAPARKRIPSMPRVSILDNRPTPERAAKAPDGIDIATGSKAQRVRSPLEVHKAHFAPELIAAATRFLRNREAVETATRTTPAYSGMPGQNSSAASQRGGVSDTRRADAAELAFVEAKLEQEFVELLELLAVGVDAYRHNQPKTVADIARRCLAYRTKDGKTETAAGVGMLWGALVRLASIYVELRAGERAASTPEEIAARLQERRRQAATAKLQFHRELGTRSDQERR